MSDALHCEERPRRRLDCIDGLRPCPWVGCRHNLFLDVSETGKIRQAFHGEPEDMPATGSCALDVADRGGATLETVGDLLGVTREAIRIIETRAFDTIRAVPGEYRDFADEGDLQPVRAVSERSDDARATVSFDSSGAPSAEDPVRVSFFAEGEVADIHVSEWVWRVYFRESVENGFERDTRKRQPLAAHLEAIQTGLTREQLMGKTDDLSPREVQMLEAHRAHLAAHGRPPSNLELGQAIGLAAKTDASLASQVSMAKRRLVDRGLIESGRARSIPAPIRAELADPEPSPEATVEPDPQDAGPASRSTPERTRRRRTSTEGDPILQELRTRHGRAQREVLALERAIVALESIERAP